MTIDKALQYILDNQQIWLSTLLLLVSYRWCGTHQIKLPNGLQQLRKLYCIYKELKDGLILFTFQAG